MSASYRSRSVIGKRVNVRGSNISLGFEFTTKFVALGASLVILGGRNLTKGKHAMPVLEQRTDKMDRVEVWQLST